MLRERRHDALFIYAIRQRRATLMRVAHADAVTRYADRLRYAVSI